MRRTLFCELGPWAYTLSLKKQIVVRNLKNLLSKERFAKEHSEERLPVVVFLHRSNMIKKGPGISPELQYNKAANIDNACRKINGLIVKPGESFSFWHQVGKTSKRNGFLDGRVLINGKLVAGVGGGLCNLANTLHLLFMNSPVTITELHHHSDALAPDPGGKRVPYSSGTSVNYNFIDLRFRNDTDRPIQLMTRCEGEDLIAEILTTKPFDTEYRIVEEDHHFHQDERGIFYRRSKIFRETIDKKTGKVIGRELKWDNKSKVMFDYEMIPKHLIR